MFAAKELNFAPSGTMAHSFVHVHESQEQSFRNFTEAYGENSILLVDTYDSVEGIKEAANLARQLHEEKGIKIRGIRIDSGDLVKLSNFARRHFQEKGVSFLKIFVSGDLDEFKIDDLLEQGGQIDGFGIGTRFAVSRFAPAIEIIYKIVQYGSKGVFKTSPGKQTRPGRKTIIRICRCSIPDARYSSPALALPQVRARIQNRESRIENYERDIISPRPFDGRGSPLQSSTNLTSFPTLKYPESRNRLVLDDLLKPFESVEQIQTIQKRLATELSLLDDSIKAIRNPEKYHVEFA